MVTYGTVDATQRAGLSRLEFVQGLARGTLPMNTIAQLLGYEITDAEHGRVVAGAVPVHSHLNPAGTVHGGLAATLLDSCMGLAIESTLEPGLLSTTLEFKISFVRASTPETGPIQAKGVVLNRTSSRNRRRSHHRPTRPAARPRHHHLPRLQQPVAEPSLHNLRQPHAHRGPRGRAA